MGDRGDEQFPALRGRRQQSIDDNVDQARRELWRAFQHGSLSEEELASTLDRLEFDRTSSQVGQEARPTSAARNSEQVD